MIKNYSKPIKHVLSWIFILLLPFIFSVADYEELGINVHKDRFDFLYLNTITTIFWIALFYLNNVILIARFIYNKRYVLFILFQIGLFVLIMLFHGALFDFLTKGHKFNFFRSCYHNIIPFLFTVISSIAFKTFSDKSKADTEAIQKQNENLKTELSFLRSQISPHFLFNVMNNIVAMVRLKSKELEPTILKLSLLMQYMLYETDEEKVLLQSEIENLQSYIDLQRQRFSKKLKLHVSLDVKENWHTIEPMLLIPFVENAFKHGTGLVQNPEIVIELKAENDKLYFVVKNKFIQTETVKDRTSGIGLTNVRRRLELLYCNQHHLSINKTSDYFIASLALTFKS